MPRQSKHSRQKSENIKISPAKDPPNKKSPLKSLPSNISQAKASPTKASPAKASPAKASPTKGSPAKTSQTKSSPTKSPSTTVSLPKTLQHKVSPIKDVSRMSPDLAQNSSTKDANSNNAPRLDKRARRFYEPLVLLKTLGTTWGEQAPPIPISDELLLLPTTDLRRIFLNELAYICDYDKDGDTVTTIGLEETPQEYVFWVAANTCPEKKAIPHLRSVLSMLKSIAAGSSQVETDISDLAETCIKFAASRIKKYLHLIRPLVQKCSRNLRSRQSDDGKSLLLITWSVANSTFFQQQSCIHGCNILTVPSPT
jgi:hypothetical protein